MKKRIMVVVLMLIATFTVACGKSNNEYSVSTGTYTMETSQSKISAPYLSIDKDKNSFTFSYDILSSYISVGTISVEVNKITAKTDDGKYTYIFEIIDNSTIKFVAEGSGGTQTVTGEVAVPDGSIFKLGTK